MHNLYTIIYSAVLSTDSLVQIIMIHDHIHVYNNHSKT